MRRLLFILLCFTLVSSCAPVSRLPTIDPAMTAEEAEKQRRLAVENIFKNQRRVQNVAWPLLAANAPLCGDRVQNEIGMTVATSEGIGRDWRTAYKDAAGIDERLTVTVVAKGSPADAAGVQPGDHIVAIDSRKAAEGSDALKKYYTNMEQRLASDDPIALKLLRNGQEKDAEIIPVKVCAFPMVSVQNDMVNAYADGSKVVVFSGILRFVNDDNELASILGHELAHNSMGHIKKQVGNRVIGAIIGGLIYGLTGVNVTNMAADLGQMAFSQEFEAEADYVGTYFAGRAGFDIDDTPNLWRRIASEHPEIIARGNTHPSTSQRFLALEASVKEVRDKQAQGMPLVPEKKETAPGTPPAQGAPGKTAGAQ